MIRLTKEQANNLVAIFQAEPALAQKYGEMITTLEAQVNDQLVYGDGYRGDLIDVVAGLIGVGSGRGTLTPNVLKALREAILSPSQLAKVRTAVEKQACFRCGTDIGDGEMSCQHGRQTFCMNCVMPSYVRCGQHHLIDLNKKAGNVIGRVTTKMIGECPQCATQRVDGVVKPIEDPVAVHLRGLNDQMRRMAPVPTTGPPTHRPTITRAAVQRFIENPLLNRAGIWTEIGDQLLNNQTPTMTTTTIGGEHEDR